jgi:DNA-binding winged helix-turn-helix (wHTH) protein
MSKEAKHFYEFGRFRVDPDKRLLLRDNQPVPLPPKAFETLLVLVQRSEKVVLKDDLMKALWPDSFVEESNLTQHIFVLRKTLGETAGENRYFATIPGRGYQFAEKVRLISEHEDLVVESHSVTQILIDEQARPTRSTEAMPGFGLNWRRSRSLPCLAAHGTGAHNGCRSLRKRTPSFSPTSKTRRAIRFSLLTCMIHIRLPLLNAVSRSILLQDVFDSHHGPT